MDHNQIIGILSNWDKIEAEIRVGLHEDFGKSKDVQDILDIIHDLQYTANTVSPLKELFNAHVTDTKNPHDVVINIGDLDILNVLYNLYNEKFGIDMSIIDFGYALVNIKRFVTKADIDAGTNLDGVMNIDTMNYVIDKHDVSPLAHIDLFRYRLPGTPLVSPPTEVFEPNIAISSRFIVERACPMNYHDINGRVKSVGPDILPIDYLFNTPAAPIFGAHRNSLLNSRTLSDVSIHGAAQNTNSDLFIITPTDDVAFLLLQEDASFGQHGFRDICPEELTGVNNYSVYVYPLDRNQLVIDVIANAAEIIESVVFDCNTSTSINIGNLTKVYSDIHELPNGWYRCDIAIDATGLNITAFDVNTILNSMGSYDTTYQGVICNSMAFWQHQITDTVLPTPPIFTTNSPITVLGTKVRRDFTTTFNPTHGSFVFRYMSPLQEIFGKQGAILRIGYNDASINDYTTAISISNNVFDPSRTRIVVYNMDNEILDLVDSEQYTPEKVTFVKRVAFTYALGYQGYGFTNQVPMVFSTNADSVAEQMLTFFKDIYDGSINYTGVDVLQLPQTIIASDATDNNSLVGGALSNTTKYRINMRVNVLELGYDSTTDLYLNGYLINFKYYSVFSSEMNLEFLLDQYIPAS